MFTAVRNSDPIPSVMLLLVSERLNSNVKNNEAYHLLIMYNIIFPEGDLNIQELSNTNSVSDG
jgi:hypothetical protein